MIVNVQMLVRENADEWTQPGSVRPTDVVAALAFRKRGEARGKATATKLILSTGHDLVVEEEHAQLVERLVRAGW